MPQTARRVTELDAEAGARALDGFVDGLRAAHDGTSCHVTVLGHSHGSTVLVEAASTGDGLAADDMIAVGSPGMRVDDASETPSRCGPEPQPTTPWSPGPRSTPPGSPACLSLARSGRTRPRGNAMTLHHRAAWRHAAALTAVLMILTACTGGGISRGKDDALQTRATAEVKGLAEASAQAVATTVGIPLNDWRTNTSPCVGERGEIADDGRWTLSGFAGIPVAPADQITSLHRIRDRWRQQGYEVTEDRIFADGTRGAVSMRDPGTGITVSLTTTKSRDSIALILASDCYLPAAGEDPANA
ncbi:alpha/beta hydrolase [Micromonospora sp. WMMC415]|uniref:alpha/beta hydrolase n=1 Tax=Micromonospora sp. WMMC415 TaxID=2675222 RepID=UPI001E5C27F7|nr:alpha/beta hydrolase [Micromonospora sp. WMMC415]